MRSPVRGRTTIVALVAIVGMVAMLAVSPALAGEPPPDPAPQPPMLGLTVDLRNDADADGGFSDQEDARGAGAPVAFRVTVANTSGVPVTLTHVSLVLDATTLDLLGGDRCPDLASEVAAGASVSCTFTLDRFLRTFRRPPRDRLDGIVQVTATHGEQSITVTDGSTVLNPNAGIVSLEVALANDADGDGVFSADEQARAPHQDVPALVTVHNTSPGTAVLRGLTATWDGRDGPLDLLPGCSLEGAKLRGAGGGHGDDHDSSHDDGHDDEEAEGHDGGHSGGLRPSLVTCSLVLEGHAPPAGTSRTTTVTATLAKGHSPTASATATASSTVSTRAPVVVQRRPGVTLATRVGPVGGPFADHDVAPGLRVPVPPAGADVAYELEVLNTGEAPLTSLTIEDDVLDPAACTVPAVLPVGSSFRCVTGRVTADVGEHAHEATVRAVGDGQSVSDSDLAWYVGVAAEDPVVDGPAPEEPEPGDPVVDEPGNEDPATDDPAPDEPTDAASGVLPDVREPVPAAPAAPPAHPAPATATLPRTGIDVALVLAGGVVVLVGGVLLLGVTTRRRTTRRRADVDGRAKA